MTYADSDFFLALKKESDWLKIRADQVLSEEKGRLWTSAATLIELLLVCARFRLDPESLVVAASEIAEIRGIELEELLLATYFMKDKKARPLDALQAALCHGDTIVTSDSIYDRLGLRRMPLERM